jgi:hypothetical protein
MPKTKRNTKTCYECGQEKTSGFVSFFSMPEKVVNGEIRPGGYIFVCEECIDTIQGK